MELFDIRVEVIISWCDGSVSESGFVCVVPACLYSEAGVFLIRERAGVTVDMTGLLPGDGTETNSQENNNTDSSDEDW